MNEPEVNLELAKTLGLMEEEYKRILEILGRTPFVIDFNMQIIILQLFQ